jgi:hypothetical protein
MIIPEYWNEKFIRLWMSFVDQVAAHFAPEASDIATVLAPVGLSDEATAITGPDSKPIKEDVRHLQNWGYSPPLWEAWQEDMLAYYQDLFSSSSYSSTPPWVLYSVDQQDKCTGVAQEPIPPFPPRTVNCTGKGVEVDVAEWAVDHGFGLAQNSLDPSWIWRDPDQSDPPPGDVNTIFDDALNVTPRPFIELQPFQALSTWCNLAVASGNPKCGSNPNAFVSVEEDVSYARSHGISAIDWYEADLVNPKLAPAIDLWRQLQATSGIDKIPTVVTAIPAHTSVEAGTNLPVTITISAPGISGFIPGGLVNLSDDFTGRSLGSVQIPPNTGTATVDVRAPKTTSGHINLTASFANAYLWLSSMSSITRVVVHGK